MAFFPPSLPSEIELGDGFADVGAEERHLAQQFVHRVESFLHHRRFVVGEEMRRVEREDLAGAVQLALTK